MTFQYIFLIFFSASIVDIALCCVGKPVCYAFDWKSWGPCDRKCGFQNRSRLLCCPGNVHPHTAEQCSKYCNITGGITGRRHCFFCANGRIDYTSMTCQCNKRFKGKCCHELVTCLDSPCLHGGTCGDSITGFVCHCDERYTGIDCGLKIERKKTSWQTVLAYLFLTILPVIILLSLTYFCAKYFKRFSKRHKRIDRRPKPIGADKAVKELSWIKVNMRKNDNLKMMSDSRKLHWKRSSNNSTDIFLPPKDKNYCRKKRVSIQGIP